MKNIIMIIKLKERKEGYPFEKENLYKKTSTLKMLLKDRCQVIYSKHV